MAAAPSGCRGAAAESRTEVSIERPCRTQVGFVGEDDARWEDQIGLRTPLWVRNHLACRSWGALRRTAGATFSLRREVIGTNIIPYPCPKAMG